MSGSEIILEARYINSSLNKIKETIKIGVIQTESASSVLLQDGLTLKSSLDEHKYVLKNALDSTNKRLSFIRNAEILEKYYLFFSLTFFTMVVLYIIFKRTQLFLWLWTFSC
jgi:hypothetical protein